MNLETFFTKEEVFEVKMAEDKITDMFIGKKNIFCFTVIALMMESYIKQTNDVEEIRSQCNNLIEAIRFVEKKHIEKISN